MTELSQAQVKNEAIVEVVDEVGVQLLFRLVVVQLLFRLVVSGWVVG